ncbi:hypothetical protein WJX81_008441 [Elliptochloris bilobata]|uniref:DUF1264-domain-containing protein n=1 Tax=Elliptochloris bilobata TaxID=381761 RepID=A0AAW1RG69_9CHLO
MAKPGDTGYTSATGPTKVASNTEVDYAVNEKGEAVNRSGLAAVSLGEKQVGSDAVPGKDPGIKSTILEAGTSLLQKFAPTKKISQHVCAFHFYAHDMTRQVEAHHYCSCANDEFRQCVIYDTDQPNARLIGIEYIISRRLFEGLPADEKKFWHSHQYEVISGQLVAPGVPTMAETLEMQRLVDTYGKTFHTWQVDRGDQLPLGPPHLMMAFTADGQLNPALLEARDKRLGVNTAELREKRKSTIKPTDNIAAGANHWEQLVGGKRKAWQTKMEQVDS